MSLENRLASKRQYGNCIWLTGLSGSGKSTIAEALAARQQKQDVAIFDGDILRQNTENRLGYTKSDRDKNVILAGRLAAVAVRNGKLAIAALISPYEETRQTVRQMFGQDEFTQVYISTPLEICERRDTKGLYARARRNEITNFTGISDIYEIPPKPDVTIDTSHISVDEAVDIIINSIRALDRKI